MIIALTLIIFTIGLSVAAAIHDFMRLKIPNYFSVLIVTCFAITAIIDHLFIQSLFTDLSTNLIIGGAVFIVMLFCFFAGLFGGGDAKLISALSFWMGTHGLAHFLMFMAIAGGILALISVGLRRTAFGKKILETLSTKIKSKWIDSLIQDKTIVPYGIAIAIGAIAGFYGAFILP